jgi:hypothetical protein
MVASPILLRRTGEGDMLSDFRCSHHAKFGFSYMNRANEVRKGIVGKRLTG